jgi:hypothetical protein
MIALALMVLTSQISLTGCTTPTYGRPATTDEITQILGLALDMPFEIISFDTPDDAAQATTDVIQQTWTIRAENAVTFTCASRRSYGGGPFQSVYRWSTTCDFAAAWVASQTDQIREPLASWQPQFEELATETVGAASHQLAWVTLQVNRWSDIIEAAKAITTVVNDLVIPLKRTTVEVGELSVELPIPEVRVKAGNSLLLTSGPDLIYFRSRGAAPLDPQKTRGDLEMGYIWTIRAGMRTDQTVPPYRLTVGDRQRVARLSFEGHEWMVLSYSDSCAGYVLTPASLQGNGGRDWQQWADQLGGDSQTHTDGSSAQVRWTVGDHTWTINQSAAATTGATSSSTSPLTATLDGQPLPLSPRPADHCWETVDADGYCYSLSEIEALFNVTISPAKGSSEPSIVTLND